MRKVCLIVIGLLLLLYTIAYSAGLDGGVMGSQYATPAQPPPLGATEGGPLSGTVLAGMDISYFQGTINWDSVKTAKDFAITKSTEGVGYTDPQFSRNQSES